MTHKATTIANAFYDLAQGEGKVLTHMQLQKLVFIAHGFYIAVTGDPLIEEAVKAWQWGPVIPPLYNKLKHYGGGAIATRIPNVPELPKGSREFQLVRAVWDGYKHFTAAQLSGITHNPGTPWTVTWAAHPFGEIPNDLIADHYKQLLAA